MTFVAEQLQVSPAALGDYGARSQTRTEHLQQIQLHLGFRDATREDFSALADWLLTTHLRVSATKNGYIQTTARFDARIRREIQYGPAAAMRCMVGR
jgi:hypothetical protein